MLSGGGKAGEGWREREDLCLRERKRESVCVCVCVCVFVCVRTSSLAHLHHSLRSPIRLEAHVGPLHLQLPGRKEGNEGVRSAKRVADGLRREQEQEEVLHAHSFSLSPSGQPLKLTPSYPHPLTHPPTPTPTHPPNHTYLHEQSHGARCTSDSPPARRHRRRLDRLGHARRLMD